MKRNVSAMAKVTTVIVATVGPSGWKSGPPEDHTKQKAVPHANHR